MAKGGMRALEHPPSVGVSQAWPQVAPSSGAPWYESLGLAEHDLQSPSERWVVHRGLWHHRISRRSRRCWRSWGINDRTQHVADTMA